MDLLWWLHPAQVLVWRLEPSILVGLAGLAAGYAWVTGLLRQSRGWGPAPSLIRQAAFYLGLLAVFIALCSPLDVLADQYLFSAHMVQHMLLTYVAPPLWLLGLPGWLVERLFHIRPFNQWLARAVSPVAAFLIFNGTMWGWHVPAAYNAALQHEGLHIVEHLSFMTAAVIGWWPVLITTPDRWLPYPARGFYAFLSTFPCTALAAILTLSTGLLYPFHAAAPRLWDITPLFDQQLGGLLMWLPGDMLFVLAALVLFGQALNEPADAPEKVWADSASHIKRSVNRSKKKVIGD